MIMLPALPHDIGIMNSAQGHLHEQLLNAYDLDPLMALDLQDKITISYS